MKTLSIGLLLLVAACASPPHAARSRPIPPGRPQVSSPAPPSGPASATPIDEEASRAWLDREIERAPRVEPPAPMVQVVERVVERPVVVTAPYDPYWSGYDHGGYQYPRYGYVVRNRRSSFPLGTALGAGIGAVVGHQSGHRGRGAWIGGGIGYLFDLSQRW